LPYAIGFKPDAAHFLAATTAAKLTASRWVTIGSVKLVSCTAPPGDVETRPEEARATPSQEALVLYQKSNRMFL